VSDDQPVSGDQSQTWVVRLAGAAAALAAAAAAQKALAAAWRAARGHQPPTEENSDEGIGLGEVLAAAALSGAIVAVVRVLATRAGARLAKRAVERSS